MRQLAQKRARIRHNRKLDFLLRDDDSEHTEMVSFSLKVGEKRPLFRIHLSRDFAADRPELRFSLQLSLATGTKESPVARAWCRNTSLVLGASDGFTVSTGARSRRLRFYHGVFVASVVQSAGHCGSFAWPPTM